MNSPLIEYSRMLRSYLREAQKGQSQFLVPPSTHGLSPEDLDTVDLDVGKVPYLLKAVGGGDAFDPYTPFLDWIRSRLAEIGIIDLASFTAQAEIYPGHQQLFAQWLSGQAAARKEIALFNEKSYEKRLMLESLWKLLVLAYKGELVVFALDMLQNAAPSTLEALVYFLKDQGKAPFVFILNVQKDYDFLSGPYAEVWNHFWETFEDYRVPLALGKNSSKIPRNRRYSLRDIKGSLIRVRILIQFFCFHEAAELLRRLYFLFIQNKGEFNKDEIYGLFEALTEISLWQGDPYLAFAHGSYAYSLLQNKGTPDQLGRIARFLSYSLLLQGDLAQSSSFAVRALEIARTQNHKPEIFWSLFYLLLAEENQKNLDFEIWKSYYREFLALGQELDITNALSYFLVNPYRMDTADYIGEATYFHDWGLSLAEANKNLYRMSDAYLQKGYFWSIKGEWESVIECYEKSENLKKQIGHGEELPNVYNGRGFFHLSVGDYQSAHSYFLKALDGLKNQRNFMEIGLTMFNLGMNSLLSENFQSSEFYFSKLIKLLSVLGVQDLVFHSRYEILLHQTYTYVKLDKWVKAMETWAKAKDLMPTDPNVVEVLFSTIVEAWMRTLDQDWAGAQGCFDRGDTLIQTSKKSLRFYVPYFYLEAGLFFRIRSQDDWAQKMLKKGYLESFQLPNASLRDRLQTLLSQNAPHFLPPVLPFPNLDFDWIIESARMEKSFRELQRQKVELELLKRFQGILSQSQDPKDLVEESIRLFQKNFFFDAAFFYVEKDGQWKEVFATANPLMNVQKSLDEILPVLRDHGPFCEILDVKTNPLTQDKHLSFTGLVSFVSHFFNELSAHLVLASGRKMTFSKNDQDTLSISLGFLVAALGKIQRDHSLQEQNSLLKNVASRDALTGLFNRRALNDRLNEEVNRFKRYGGRSFSVLFLDLDNLSRFNEEFGHLAGDSLLKGFSRLLERSVRMVDLVSRFGGDEFVIVLPETLIDGAEILASRIMEALVTGEELLSHLPSLTGHIERESLKYLTCTIGIAEYVNNRPGTILEWADEALMEQKKQGGNGYRIYQG